MTKDKCDLILAPIAHPGLMLEDKVCLVVYGIIITLGIWTVKIKITWLLV